MITVASDLMTKLKDAGVPAIGLAIGRLNDKATWRIDFAGGATDEQRASAASIVAAFNPNAPKVPASVKMWQAKAALSMAGKLEAANAAVVAAGGPVAIAWEYAADVSRASPSMATIGAAVGLTEADIDALFIAAAAIQV